MEFQKTLLDAFSSIEEKILKKQKEDKHLLAQAILYSLYPHLLKNIPSFTVAEFTLKKESEPKPIMIKKGERFFVFDDKKYFFSSCFSQTLWPISLETISLDFQNDALVLNLKITADTGFNNLPTKESDKLLFYVDPAKIDSEKFLSLLSNKLEKLEIKSEKNFFNIQKKSISIGNFSPDSHLFSEEDNTDDASSYLMDYFIFRQKFYFFEICNIHDIFNNTKGSELLLSFYFKSSHDFFKKASYKDFIKINCSVFINFFEKICEPLKISKTDYEYPLYPAMQQSEGEQEIENIISMTFHSPSGIEKIAPFFYQKYHQDPHFLYYPLKKTDSSFYVSFSNKMLDFQNQTPPIINARVCCSNKYLPKYFYESSGLKLKWENNQNKNIEKIITLSPFTRKLKWIENPEDHWRYLSLIYLKLPIDSYEQISLTEIFKKILHFHLPLSTSSALIDKISDLTSKPFLTYSELNPQQLSKGIEFFLSFDSTIEENDFFIFKSVIERYLKLHTPLNFISKLTVNSRTIL
ncbi:MAG: hypothetical protein A3I12_04190 [Gammaproteobacteria bacterium RIFCSPLOWO2_02_FULL_38_11]|nr:MAG: hypothetical protein A3I12_04190 [Gammaproteobacteria bacterium RIFCSPLOWO2_02_FULL_38_11]OGT75272.1 MAG: hypothetical protein A3G71_01345 [Gammaproteobacteria bacterium RIFCSPLOWO2_12_FULL_38_14]